VAFRKSSNAKLHTRVVAAGHWVKIAGGMAEDRPHEPCPAKSELRNSPQGNVDCGSSRTGMGQGPYAQNFEDVMLAGT